MILDVFDDLTDLPDLIVGCAVVVLGVLVPVRRLRVVKVTAGILRTLVQILLQGLDLLGLSIVHLVANFLLEFFGHQFTNLGGSTAHQASFISTEGVTNKLLELGLIEIQNGTRSEVAEGLIEGFQLPILKGELRHK